jgi:ABC-type proline/glycine betaine transport system ATPase subunit
MENSEGIDSGAMENSECALAKASERQRCIGIIRTLIQSKETMLLLPIGAMDRECLRSAIAALHSAIEDIEE